MILQVQKGRLNSSLPQEKKKPLSKNFNRGRKYSRGYFLLSTTKQITTTYFEDLA